MKFHECVLYAVLLAMGAQNLLMLQRIDASVQRVPRSCSRPGTGGRTLRDDHTVSAGSRWVF